MAPASVAGAVAGGLLGHALPERVLLGSIAAVLAWNGLDLLVRPGRGRPRAEPRRAPAAVAGAVIGLVGGAIGVILGTLRMPALLHVVGLDARRAVGTNLVVGVFLGVAGLAAHAARNAVDLELLFSGLAGGLPGAWLGARLTGRTPELRLRRLIGAALIAIAGAFAAEALLT